MLRPTKLTLGVLAALALALPAQAAKGPGTAADPGAVGRLKTETGAALTLSPATGTVRFARAGRGKGLANAGAMKRSDHALAFIGSHARAFGLRDARSELRLQGQAKDAIGDARVSYLQVYRGLPVFGATLKAHYDASGKLKAVNGVTVPDIAVNPVPSRSAGEAAKVALAAVEGSGVTVRNSRLLVFREGLAKGVPGANHLAFEVEVGNGADIREFVYVDAHTGRKIDQISGIHDGMFRVAFDAAGATAPGPNFPSNPFWVEGDALPTGNVEADNMIYASGETYDFFFNAFGRDSFNDAGATMLSFFNRGNACPNASWNGSFISFCPGMTSDDVTAHEWGHAYTQYTHGLIYQWQPGALNESYSDIWGETVDRLNGRQTDTPFAERTLDGCSVYGGHAPHVFRVNSPASIAGEYFTGGAAFNPASGSATGDVILGNDGVANDVPGGSTTDACGPLVGFPAGSIALVDRGGCNFAVKVKNAQNSGASAVLVANTATGVFGTMGGSDPTITIPSVMLSHDTGNLLKVNLPANATVDLPAPSDDSVRWLIGEDDTAVGLTGPLRDMWSPQCYGNAGKVSDTNLYTCSTADGGGVHSNSGVPNHAYALLVDGGTYNGQSVAAIGLTKAAHVYFRAQAVYQHPATDFADHADAIEQSCADLVGTNLADLQSGLPSGQVVSAADCAQVAKAALAVELRTPPSQCNFQPLLAQSPPAQCPGGVKPSYFFQEKFENGDSAADRWSVSRTAVNATSFVPRDWQVVGGLPDGRSGRAFFAPDPDLGNCSLAQDQSGVLHLFSPEITVASSVADARMSFDHWVATEAGWDGGNLKISVNGGAWQLVADTDYVYNGHNRTLLSAGAPNFNSNPMAGQRAFSGSDGGAVDGSWGRSVINLAPYAPPGAKVRLRFDLGTDICTGSFGWYVDDVSLYTCKSKK